MILFALSSLREIFRSLEKPPIPSTLAFQPKQQLRHTQEFFDGFPFSLFLNDALLSFGGLTLCHTVKTPKRVDHENQSATNHLRLLKLPLLGRVFL